MAQQQRYWKTVLTFALANLGIWLGYHFIFGRSTLDLLRVESFAPGNGAIVDARPQLQWKFNLDVAPQGKDEAPGTTSPAVAGRWTWSDARTLSFTPDQDLAHATNFTLTLMPERFRTAQGIHLAKAYSVTVHTEPLRVVELRQRSFDEQDRFVLEIEFNDNVLAADVPRTLKLTDSAGHVVKFTQHGQSDGKILRVLTDQIPVPPEKKEGLIFVRIDAGLAGTSGPLAMERAFEQKLTLQTVLMATEARASAPMRENASIRLVFNSEVDAAVVRPLLSLEPAVPFTVSGEGAALQLHGDFQPGARYAVKIAKSNQARAPRADVLSVFVPDRQGGVWFEHDEGYLGSRGNRTLLAHMVNVAEVKLTIWRMYANNVVQWRNAQRGQTPTPYSRPVLTKTIKSSAARNRVEDVRISLPELLGAQELSDGVYQVTLERTGARRRGRSEDDEEDSYAQVADSALVTLSDIGLTAKRCGDAVIVWALSLSRAAPIPQARIQLFSDKNQLLGSAQTDEQGLARIEHLQPAQAERPAVIIAESRAASASGPATVPTESGLTWLDLRGSGWNLASADVAGRSYLRSGYEAFVYTDRGVYRPGEMVHLRAIVRGPGGAKPEPFPVKWQLKRPDLRDWRNEIAMLDGEGACGLDLKLPDDLVTGTWSASVELPGDKSATSVFGGAPFQIEEFMPARLKVTVHVGDAGGRIAIVEGQAIVARIKADYLFGAAASGLRSALSARLDPSTFTSKKWADWTFGDSAQVIGAENTPAIGAVATKEKTGEIVLDEKGGGQWEMPLGAMLAKRSEERVEFRGPWKLSVSADVREEGGRAVVAATSAELDALPWYIGVRPERDGAVTPAAPSRFNLRLVKPDGEAMSDNAVLEASVWAEHWNNALVFRNGRYQYDSHRVLERVPSAVSSQVEVKSGSAAVDVTAPASGVYALRLRDPRSGALTSFSFYASDGSAWADSVSRESPERLELIVLPAATTLPATMPVATAEGEAHRLKVGDRPQILVRSPFAGRLLLTVETDRVLQGRVIEMAKSQVSVPIDISPEHWPNAYVTATVVRAVEPDVKWRTHRAYGATRISVDPGERKLNVQVMTPAEIRPRSRLEASVCVTDACGVPVRDAAVTLAAVDEGILQLTRFTTPDPLAFFAADRALGVSSGDIYSLLMPEVPRPEKVSSAGGDADVAARHHSPVVAQRVKPVALFSGVLHADESGVARTYFEVPEFAGKLRVMAVGYAASAFGSAEANVLIRGPLVVQSSFPRFAAPRDQFTVPIVVINNSPDPGKLRLKAEIAGAQLGFVRSDSPALVLEPIALPANGRTTAHISFLTKSVGVAKVRLTAEMGAERFDQTIELPVRPCSPLVTRGGFAGISPGKPLALDLDRTMMSGTETIQVNVTPWPTLQLPEGLDYLERYSYGCAEQTISTAFPLIALRDLGAKIAPGMFAPDRVKEKVDAGITRLIGMQAGDGGVAMWSGVRESWPWASVYAAHFILEAQAAGYRVPEDFRGRLLTYARRLLEHSGDDAATLETQAYACFVLALSGQPPHSSLSRLSEICSQKSPATPPESVASAGAARMHLAMAYLSAGRRDLAGPLINRKFIPRTRRESGGTLGSATRDRAILLEVMLMTDADDAALPAMAQELADEGKKGQWRSTQDCAFAVMALGKYLRTAKSAAPFETAQLLAGENQLARADKALTWTSAATTQAAAGALRVQITGSNDARGHVSWLQSGVGLSPPVAADNGMTVRRRYLDRDGKALNSNVLRSGDLVRVELRVEAPPYQKNLVIEDLLPAGLEVENPRLEASARAQGRERDDDDLVEPRTDMRDDRFIVVGSMNERGKARYEYLARAVTPGTFIVPPVRGECMYDIAMRSINGIGEQIVVRSGDQESLAHDE